jgi:hypothetical protein
MMWQTRLPRQKRTHLTQSQPQLRLRPLSMPRFMHQRLRPRLFRLHSRMWMKIPRRSAPQTITRTHPLPGIWLREWIESKPNWMICFRYSSIPAQSETCSRLVHLDRVLLRVNNKNHKSTRIKKNLKTF